MEFSYIIDDLDLLQISPKLFSYEIIDAGKVVFPSVHNYFIFCFVVNGSAVFSNGKAEFERKKNQAILLYPNDELSYKVSKDSDLKVIFLGFSGSNAVNFVRRMMFSKENIIFDYPSTKDLLTYFSADANYKKGGYCLALSALFKVASYFSLDENKTIVSEAIEYINSHIIENIRINDLSLRLGISRIHLYNLFNEQLGVAPKEYIINRKMKIAYDAIKNQHFSIKGAASIVGYEDPFSFSKMFKQKYNITPRDVQQGKVPQIMVLNDEEGETIWPAEITTEHVKVGSHSYVTKPYYNKERDIVEGWLLRAGYKNSIPLPRTLDISRITEDGNSGFLTFWIFIKNQSIITDWHKNTADWIRFGSSTDWDSDCQYWLGWHKQITKEGWNKIVLPFGDSEWGHIIGKPNYKKFCSFSIVLSVKPIVQVFIDDIKVISN